MDIGNWVDDRVTWADGLPPTNLDWTENESCSNNYNIRNTMNKKIPFIEDI